MFDILRLGWGHYTFKLGILAMGIFRVSDTMGRRRFCFVRIRGLTSNSIVSGIHFILCAILWLLKNCSYCGA